MVEFPLRKRLLDARAGTKKPLGGGLHRVSR
jgi:hypothetical protein